MMTLRDASGMTFQPLAFFLYEEMQARGWNCEDVATRMPGDYRVNLLTFELVMAVQEDNCLIGDFVNSIAAAFGVSPEFISNLDKGWRDNKDNREAFTCPEHIFSESVVLLPDNDLARSLAEKENG